MAALVWGKPHRLKCGTWTVRLYNASEGEQYACYAHPAVREGWTRSDGAMVLELNSEEVLVHGINRVVNWLAEDVAADTIAFLSAEWQKAIYEAINSHADSEQ